MFYIYVFFSPFCFCFIFLSLSLKARFFFQKRDEINSKVRVDVEIYFFNRENRSQNDGVGEKS